MKSTILSGADNFMTRLSETAQSATRSLHVQAMTFEGDQAGEQLIDIMIACPAPEKYLLVDSFSKVVVSDSFVFSSRYLTDSAFRREIVQTYLLLEKARKAGVQVQFTNPVGWLMLKYPLRNHKKMVIVDGHLSYIGGINFSDHNFAWHDLMVELEDEGVGRLLVEDFEKTWSGVNQSLVHRSEQQELYFLNGVNSHDLYDQLFDKLINARSSVQIISPYVSEPLLSILKKCPNHLDVSIIAPEDNNKSVFKKYLLSELDKGYFKLFHYPGMSHLKAIIIDGEEVVFGSSNYDVISYYFEQEVVMTSRDAGLVENFKKAIFEPALNQSKQVLQGEKGGNFKTIQALQSFSKWASKSMLRPK